MNILIADDEYLSRTSLIYLIKNTHLAHFVITEVEDGLELIQALKSQHFDIAFVDIRMPNLSGLDALQKIKNHYPNVLFYILTGFGEFEYAQRAISLHVSDYFLKPIDKNKLVQVLTYALSHQLYLDTQKKEKLTNLSHQLFLFYNGIETDNIDFQNYCLTPIFFTSPMLDVILEYLEENFIKQLTIQFPHIHIHHTLCNTHVTLFIYYPDDEVDFICNKINSFIKSLLTQELLYTLSCFIGYPIYTAKEFNALYNTFDKYYPLSIIKGINNAYMLQNIEVYINSDLLDFCKNIELMCASFAEKNWLNLDYYSNKIQNLLLKLKIEETSSFYLNTIIYIKKYLLHQYNYHLSLTCIDDIINRLKQDILITLSPEHKISNIVNYVNSHYIEDISIDTLSIMFNLSPTYISTLFKKFTSKKFTDYVSELRIRHAKNLLLNTRATISEVSKEVGYYSPSHFIKIFVRYENCTPLKFRTMHRH